MRALFLIAILFAAAGCATTRQPPLAPPGISLEQKVTLGGCEQTIFIRGRNRANPVLLFLHGGPGLAEMPFSHVNAELERDFVVVHWDQRGAGKSYRPDIPPETMNTEQFVLDTIELSRHLCRTFGPRKIYLAGFSWGSLVGALAVARAPELYHAYIGISQFVALPDSEVRLYEAGIATAGQRGFPRIAERLRSLGPATRRSRHDERLVNRLTKEIQPRLPVEMMQLRYLSLGLRSPYYSLLDDVRLVRGLQFSGRALEEDIWSADLRRLAPRLDLPVYFFLGRYDTVLSAPLAAEYLRTLHAPRGKHLVWFEHSDHILHLEEPARFREEVRRVLAETRRAEIRAPR